MTCSNDQRMPRASIRYVLNQLPEESALHVPAAIDHPPSATITEPLIKALSFDVSHTMTCAASSGVPTLARGFRAPILFRISLSASRADFQMAGDATVPIATALAFTPSIDVGPFE